MLVVVLVYYPAASSRRMCERSMIQIVEDKQQKEKAEFGG